MKILVLLLCLAALSGCSKEYINLHSDFRLSKNCIFEKFTEKEKAYLKGMNSIGRRIGRNQNACKVRHQRNEHNLNTHNESYQSEK